MNKKVLPDLILGICLALSVFLSYQVVSQGYQLAVAGKEPNALLSVGAIITAIVLVLVGIILKIKLQK